MDGFELDTRLAGDTFAAAELPLCELRVMDDRRWPWLILVPRIADAVEIHDLEPGQQAMLARETAMAAGWLKAVTGCEKINSGALGNVVRQLHVHVVARSEGDPNWPGPVWGHGLREAMDAAEQTEFLNQLARQPGFPGNTGADH